MTIGTGASAPTLAQRAYVRAYYHHVRAYYHHFSTLVYDSRCRFYVFIIN